jgi:antitoxin (DNA-binding transcriptional repressor) of toxin-antitoxin stability system
MEVFMCKVNVLEAKTNLSKLLMLLETKQEDEVIICKNNNPIAVIKLIPQVDVSKRIGIAKGKITVPDLEEFNSMDEEIAQMFYGED